jgi:hypothetical protein
VSCSAEEEEDFSAGVRTLQANKLSRESFWDGGGYKNTHGHNSGEQAGRRRGGGGGERGGEGGEGQAEGGKQAVSAQTFTNKTSELNSTKTKASSELISSGLNSTKTSELNWTKAKTKTRFEKTSSHQLTAAAAVAADAAAARRPVDAENSVHTFGDKTLFLLSLRKAGKGVTKGQCRGREGGVGDWGEGRLEGERGGGGEWGGDRGQGGEKGGWGGHDLVPASENGDDDPREEERERDPREEAAGEVVDRCLDKQLTDTKRNLVFWRLGIGVWARAWLGGCGCGWVGWEGVCVCVCVFNQFMF